MGWGNRLFCPISCRDATVYRQTDRETDGQTFDKPVGGWVGQMELVERL